MENRIDREPLVSLFLMGKEGGEWIHGNTYPLEGTRLEKWYLASDGHANTSKGDGKLTAEAPGEDVPPDRYVYDPGDPTPAPVAYFEDEETEKLPRKEREKLRKAHHASVLEARKDILVYTSEPLTKALTFAGPISATLHASTSARDTDWYVSLSEVTEEGEIHPLVSGKLRARYRGSMKKPEPVEPGRIEEYRIDLWQTGATIPKGYRLRLEVASAYFPLFSRNLNTGGHNETETEFVAATQTIHHDAKHPSHVLLPVLPR